MFEVVNDATPDKDQEKAHTDERRAELAAVDIGPEPTPVVGPGPAGNATPPASSWVPIVGGLVPAIAKLLLPNWGLTPDECNEFSAKAGAALDKYFPDPAGKWQQEMELIGVTAIIALPRIAKKVPLRVQRVPAADNHSDSSTGLETETAPGMLDPNDPLLKKETDLD